MKKTTDILKDHPLHNFYYVAQSGCRYISERARINCYCNTFLPPSVRLLKSKSGRGSDWGGRADTMGCTTIINFCIVLYTTKCKYLGQIIYFISMYTSSLWCKLKNLSLKSITVVYNNSLRILLNLPSRHSASFMFATNYIKSFNERIRSSIFSLYVIFISLKTLYLSITFILIDILEAQCTHTGDLLLT